MAIPDYQTIMLPLLKYSADGHEHRFRDAVEALADEFSLSDEDRRELLPSGQQPLFNNRVGWSRLYLVKAGLLAPTRRSYFQITEQGRTILSQKLERIDKNFLMQFPGFAESLRAKKGKIKVHKPPVKPFDDTTPEESLEAAFQELQEGLASGLLQNIKECSPNFFERLVVDLLVKIGYGGSRKEAGQAIGRTGDGGIDGIIKEDKLGLDIIYEERGSGLHSSRLESKRAVLLEARLQHVSQMQQWRKPQLIRIL